jgi:uncharacterized protein YdeI (BOF family)
MVLAWLNSSFSDPIATICAPPARRTYGGKSVHISLQTIAGAAILFGCGVAFADNSLPRNWVSSVQAEVLKIDGDVYLVEDGLGREMKLILTTTSQRDESIRIGDEVKIRILHKGKEVHIKSLTRIAKVSLPAGAAELVEGKLIKILQQAYLLKDISGRELWLEVDGSTWKDGNITVGDMIVAQTDATDSLIRARSLSKR